MKALTGIEVCYPGPLDNRVLVADLPSLEALGASNLAYKYMKATCLANGLTYELIEKTEGSAVHEWRQWPAPQQLPTLQEMSSGSTSSIVEVSNSTDNSLAVGFNGNQVIAELRFKKLFLGKSEAGVLNTRADTIIGAINELVSRVQALEGN